MQCSHYFIIFQITFKYEEYPEELPQEKISEPPSHEDTLQAQLAEQLQLPSLADTTASVNTKATPPLEGKVRFYFLYLMYG